MKKWYLIPLGIFLLLATALGVGLTLNPSEVPSPLIGKPAPFFEGRNLHDPERTLSLNELRGEVVVVNVWASWCAACLDEHTYVKALADSGVPVYGINYKDERDEALHWLRRYGDVYAASVFDADGRIGLDWGVYGVPETFVLDERGVVRHKHIGAIDADSLRNELLPLIESLRAEAGS